MARSKSYRGLIVWQKSMALAQQAYSLTVALPKSEAFGLLAQITLAAVSVPSNIAEGHGRLTDLQFRHFLGNARGSLYELETQIELAGNLGYINHELVKDLLAHGEEVVRLINGLVSSLGRGKIGMDNSPMNSANNANSAHQGIDR